MHHNLYFCYSALPPEFLMCAEQVYKCHRLVGPWLRTQAQEGQWLSWWCEQSGLYLTFIGWDAVSPWHSLSLYRECFGWWGPNSWVPKLRKFLILIMCFRYVWLLSFTSSLFLMKDLVLSFFSTGPTEEE